MKTSCIITLLLMLSSMAFSQNDNVTVCHTSSIEKFAFFASDKQFNGAHAEPLPFTYESEVGRMITFKTPDGKQANGYLLTSKNKTNNWIFVFQEWWGLNDYIKRQSEKIYNDLSNVNVLALDMFDGKVTSSREEASKYMAEFKQERGTAIIQGALDYVGKDAKIGTIGWCFGGGESMQAAIIAGSRAAACVMYYGMPEKNIERLKTLKCDVLEIWATQDKWINKELMDKFSANMKALNKNLIIKPYDADHAFANPSNAKHNKEFTADAYKNAIAFFKARLK